jgi:hypothetical protein
VIGSGWTNLIEEGDRETVLEEWNRCVKESRQFSMEFSVINRRTKAKIPVVCYAKPIKEKGFMGVIKQINMV